MKKVDERDVWVCEGGVHVSCNQKHDMRDISHR